MSNYTIDKILTIREWWEKLGQLEEKGYDWIVSH